MQCLLNDNRVDALIALLKLFIFCDSNAVQGMKRTRVLIEYVRFVIHALLAFTAC